MRSAIGEAAARVENIDCNVLASATISSVTFSTPINALTPFPAARPLLVVWIYGSSHRWQYSSQKSTASRRWETVFLPYTDGESPLHRKGAEITDPLRVSITSRCRKWLTAACHSPWFHRDLSTCEHEIFAFVCVSFRPKIKCLHRLCETGSLLTNLHLIHEPVQEPSQPDSIRSGQSNPKVVSHSTENKQEPGHTPGIETHQVLRY